MLYAFNHQESHRAFEEAARLDPSLAMACLELQGRTAEATVVRARFTKASSRADVTLTSSRVLSDDRTR